LHFSFRLKNQGHLPFILMSILMIEFFLYTFLTSPGKFYHGIINGLISIICYFIFFYKSLLSSQGLQ